MTSERSDAKPRRRLSFGKQNSAGGKFEKEKAKELLRELNTIPGPGPALTVRLVAIIATIAKITSIFILSPKKRQANK
jgi:hypothetical protein